MQNTVITRKPRTRTRKMKGGWINTYVVKDERQRLVQQARDENPQYAEHAAVEVDYTFPTGTRVTFDDTRPVEAGF